MAGRLTTHVLDTANGRPAAGMAVALYRLGPGPDDRALLVRTTTDADGRAPAPLLAGDDLTPGVYELVFAVGPYFAARSAAPSGLPFLDRVPVRFGIADPDAHYHVPLLVSPWSYTTYRGS
jgi:5-hydroxyisourate hydrolase